MCILPNIGLCNLKLWLQLLFIVGFPRGSMVKNLPANAEDARDLGGEDPLEEEMATQSSILAWEIPWREEPGGLQSMGSQKVGHYSATKQQLFIIVLKASFILSKSSFHETGSVDFGIKSPEL